MNSLRNQKIEQIIYQMGLPLYTHAQVYDAIYKKGVKSFEEITSLSKLLRQQLTGEIGEVLTLKKLHEITGEHVLKVLFETKDGNRIESVIMKYKEGTKEAYNSLCLSTQCGCAMRCKFCATGNIGFLRHLTTDEIVDQYLYFKQQGLDIKTVFFSGMGEPFANPNIFDALEILTNPKFMGISERKISVSTIGIIPGIKALSQTFPQINLALSLHFSDQEERNDIMPAVKGYTIKEVFEALDEHIEKTNRKVFIAYIMLGEINDSPDHAQDLADLIKGQKKPYLYHVNLIKFHKGPTEIDFEPSSKNKIAKFVEILDKNHIECTIRQDFGLEVEAACGQLYAKYQTKNK